MDILIKSPFRVQTRFKKVTHVSCFTMEYIGEKV